MSDDTELLRRYAHEKSEGAFAELVRRHLDLVYSAALRRLGGDAHRAKDVAQQVFTTLARDAKKLSRHAVLTAWLYTATRNAAIDLIRSEQRRHAREQEASTMQNLFAASPDTDWEKLRPVLDHMMDELSDADRSAVLLRFFEKRGFTEVGAALHLTEDAARMRVDRALEKLRALLARRGVTSTAGALSAVLANQAVAIAPAGLAASIKGAALASASGTAASTLGILQFMSTTKSAVGAAAIIAILALGTAGYQVHALRDAESALVVADQNHAAFAATLRGLERQAQATEQEAAQLQQRAQEIRATDAAATTPASTAPDEWNPIKEGAAFLERHPEVKQTIIEEMNGAVLRRYGPLLKKLGLTPAQIAQFQDLARESRAISTAVTSDGKTGRLYYSTGLSRDEAQNGIHALLGEDGFEQFKNFTNSAGPARLFTSQVAEMLCFSDTPLRPQQADQLIAVLSTNWPNSNRWSDADENDIDAKARGMFSAVQLPAWNAFVDYLRLRKAADLERIRAAAKANSSR
ncbi:MAG: RNA polymerase sigma factor [Opitutus sp.]|nr:RNA polymerase sigma factor [Opitutus sp.]